MKDSQAIIDLVKEQGVIPLFYNDDLTVCTAVIDALYKAGIRIVEFTNRGEQALTNFKALLEIRNEQWADLLLGVGTIKTTAQAKQFIDAGTDFVICPGTIPDVAKVVHDAGLLWIPGCMTTTEIIIAEQHGAGLVKLFPGSLLGPSYVSAVKEIFPGLLFMPTGGVEVTEENMHAWFKSGVCAVGLGSKVISKELLAKKEYGLIQQAAETALALSKKIRSGLST